jgi:hypothetical protein
MTTTTVTPTPSIRRSTAVTIAVAAAVVAAGTALVVPRLNVETAGSAARPTATQAALPAAQAAVITEGNALDRKMDTDHKKQTALAASVRVPDGSDVAESKGHDAMGNRALVPDASDIAEQDRLDHEMLIEARTRAASSSLVGQR